MAPKTRPAFRAELPEQNADNSLAPVAPNVIPQVLNKKRKRDEAVEPPSKRARPDPNPAASKHAARKPLEMGKHNTTKKAVKKAKRVDKIAKPKIVFRRIKADDKEQFKHHLRRPKPALNFHLRPSIGNSSLLARRSRTNADELAASTSGSLVPTTGNLVDLVTPEPPTGQDNLEDSGYISLNSTASPPPPVGMPNTTDPNNLPQYRATMEQTTERIFFKKYVAKNFKYDSRNARERLRPIMRKALDRMEDRPIVNNKFYLHINWEMGTIRGEHRYERLRKEPGQRAKDEAQHKAEGKSYVSYRHH
jgi:hypothetical protein